MNNKQWEAYKKQYGIDPKVGASPKKHKAKIKKHRSLKAKKSGFPNNWNYHSKWVTQTE